MESVARRYAINSVELYVIKPNDDIHLTAITYIATQ